MAAKAEAAANGAAGKQAKAGDGEDEDEEGDPVEEAEEEVEDTTLQLSSALCSLAELKMNAAAVQAEDSDRPTLVAGCEWLQSTNVCCITVAHASSRSGACWCVSAARQALRK
jgi:hypothetical protein